MQPQIAVLGAEIFAAIRGHQGGNLFSRKWLCQRLMNWSMRDERFKTQLFRFVDVLPTLEDSGAVLDHLREYLALPGLPLEKLTTLGLGAARLFPPLPAWLVRQNIKAMSDLFIVGRTGHEALPVLRRLWKEQARCTVDILGEAVVSDLEADEYARRYLELLDALALETHHWRVDGPLATTEPPLINVSVKISALCARINPASPETAIAAILSRLTPIFRRAKELGAFINLDMESHAVKDLTLRLFRKLLLDSENCPEAGCVIQAYLRDSEQDLRELLDWCAAQGRKITVRLVKGAYWDYERIIARQRDWPVPVYEQKAETDANYERLTRLLLERSDVVYPAFATHNVRSIAHALAWAEKLGRRPGDYEFQALYGMAEPIRRALVARGERVREYCPVGELLPGMAYLVRRLLENTSNEGFLRVASGKNQDDDALLAEPLSDRCSHGPVGRPEPAPHLEDASPRRGRNAFTNHPPLDFAIEANRQLIREALIKVRKTLGENFPLVIDGRSEAPSDFLPSPNPAQPREIIGQIGSAAIQQADHAVLVARQALPKWSAIPRSQRVEWLNHVADLLAARRAELTALEVLEVGKTWAEADADVCEAIDFCRFYALEAATGLVPRLTQSVPGETSFLEHWPRGVGVIVAPWNFPLAILCGMAAAALVCGNTVILKPAEQSSVIAARFHAILLEAGLPPGAAAFLPGRGEIIGAHLTGHPQVDFIAFTGSKEVGLQIWETAGQTPPRQHHLKKVICEMGGKNALIIDADADLDEAVAAILHSAFGFQGQKCSALSRLIVLAPVYEALIRRLVEAARALRIGPPEDPANDLGPVIDEAACAKIHRFIEDGKKTARLVFQSDLPFSGEGWFVPVTIFADVPPEASIFREEIFGPVLAITPACDLDEALRVANDTAFALTGGVFSRSPSTIERVKRELRVGNLYINRSITGAIVGRHPFGGFDLSGGGTKAGGGDYLQHFVLPRVVTENTLRRGFAPELEEKSPNPIFDLQQ